jgi:glycosyltransferase involved in cell wall biosynthesis
MREFWLLDDAPVFGGAEQNTLRLARFIDESLPDHAVRVVCPSTSELAKRCQAARIPVTHATFPDLSLFAALRIALAIRHLRRVISAAGDDAFLVGPSLRTQVYAHAAVLGLRRSLPIVHFMPEQDSARRLTARLLLRRAVVVVGDNAGRAYGERLGGVQVRVVNNFLLPEEVAAARYSTPPRNTRPPVLGVLARLIPEKGVLELVGELSEESSAWASLFVAGERQDERYAQAIERQVGALRLDRRVRLIGHVDDLAAFFGEIDALVVPSVGNEGQPTVIIEALAHGRPVIVRQPIWQEAFDGLPVLRYHDAEGLGRALAQLEPATVAPDELVARFGPTAVIEALQAAADEARR